MEFEYIYEKEYDTCNRFVVKTCASVIVFIMFVWILNLLGIFVVKPKAMAFVCIVTILLMAIPVCLYLLKKNGRLKNIRFDYVTLVIMLISITVLYSFLTFHVILMFLLPAVTYNIYGNKRLMRFVMAGTITVMIVSHIASYYCGVNPEEPFTQMYTILIFGLFPKIIIFLAFCYAFLYQTDHNNRMILSIYNYSRDLHSTQQELIMAFSEMSESKSGQTGKHVKRVASYVEVMAKELGISGTECECLVTASMMHDAGKLNIPREILDKPGRLTQEEFEVIKKHTEYGYELLKNSPGRTMEIAAKIARYHHERWDGKGYNGIAGEDIDYYSRIMAIADVFDALVSKRSYKEKWKTEDAYNEIVNQSGKQFDPQLVEVFKKCYSRFVDIVRVLPD